MDNMTLRALQSSDIFSSYLATEEQKIKANIKTAEQEAEDNLKMLNDFEDLQNKINSSLKLKEKFKHLQHLFQTNEEYAATVDQSFVDGVLLLKID